MPEKHLRPKFTYSLSWSVIKNKERIQTFKETEELSIFIKTN